MRISSRRAIVALVVTLAAAGCGSDAPESAMAPTTLAPFIGAELPESLEPSVAGLWGGPATLTSVTGGTGAVADAGVRACVGDAIAGSGGMNEFLLAIQQDGSTLTARLTSAVTGLAGTYSGTKGESQFVLDTSSWDAEELTFVCPTLREGTLTLVGSSIVANFERIAAPPTLTGTMAHTFNVEFEGGGLEGVVTQFSITMARR